MRRQDASRFCGFSALQRAAPAFTSGAELYNAYKWRSEGNPSCYPSQHRVLCFRFSDDLHHDTPPLVTDTFPWKFLDNLTKQSVQCVCLIRTRGRHWNEKEYSLCCRKILHRSKAVPFKILLRARDCVSPCEPTLHYSFRRCRTLVGSCEALKAGRFKSARDRFTRDKRVARVSRRILDIFHLPKYPIYEIGAARLPLHFSAIATFSNRRGILFTFLL